MDRVKRECRNTSPSTIRTYVNNVCVSLWLFTATRWRHKMADVADVIYCMIASGQVLLTHTCRDSPFCRFMQNTHVYCIELVVNCCLLVFQYIYVYIYIYWYWHWHWCWHWHWHWHWRWYWHWHWYWFAVICSDLQWLAKPVHLKTVN